MAMPNLGPVKALTEPIKGLKTYLVGGILLLNVIYTLIAGEAAPTFDDPTGTDVLLEGSLGAGFMTIRAAISTMNQRLEALTKIINK